MANVRTLKRRKLSDLYVVGKEIIFDDGSGEEPVAVWISKISPIEQRNAVDAAASERARVLLFKRLPEDDATRLRFRDQLAEMDGENRDTLVEFLISAKMYEAELSAESRLGAEEPWSKDDYLKGLQDLWVKEMKERYYRDEVGGVSHPLSSFCASGHTRRQTHHVRPAPCLLQGDIVVIHQRVGEYSIMLDRWIPQSLLYRLMHLPQCHQPGLRMVP